MIIHSARPGKSPLAVAGLAIVSCLLWSTAFAAIKVGLRSSGPFFLAGMRFMLAGIMLVPFCGSLKGLLKFAGSNLRLVSHLALFQIIILYGTYFYALTLLPSALVAIMVGSSPLITAVVSHFLMKGDRMNLPKTASLLAGVAGIIVLSMGRKPWTARGASELWGIVLLLAGTVSSSFGNIIVARQKSPSPLMLNAAQTFIGGFVLFAASLVLEGIPSPLHPPEFYLSLLWLSFISAAAFSLWFILLTTPGVKVSELNIWKFLIPLFGACLSWLVFPDESPEALSVAGMVLIALSVLLLNLVTAFRKEGTGRDGREKTPWGERLLRGGEIWRETCFIVEIIFCML